MSEWRETQEINERLNIQRAGIADILGFLKEQVLNEENEELIVRAIGVCQAADKVLGECYLSSGYRYDDEDPRNQMDVFGDSWDERTEARNGTNAEDEMRSEIAREIALKHYEGIKNDLFVHLSGFNEWYQNRQDELSESWTDERDDDHDW